ncbi:glycosaminoglycan xylosylkinase-like [Babylonia areolata]|uniref:glycosaminoglycan xylosylkinase-like n=1 Tax=Babylonia areolata TaxID=304850 RepID=UPI003FD24C46
MAGFRAGGFRASSTPRLKLRFQILVALTLIFMITVSIFILQPDFLNNNNRIDEFDDFDRLPEPDEHVVVNSIDFAPAEAVLKNEGGVVGNVPVEKAVQQLVEKYHVDFESVLEPADSAWSIAAGWVTSRQVLPESAPELGAVLHAMATSPIVSVDNGIKGTQLKLTLTLAGGQTVIFKPKWYERDYIVEGPPYAGRDRHNGEIAAFHLSRILGLRRTPLAVGRTVSISRDLIPVASSELLKTFYEENGETCFYGKCLYCNKANSLCTKGDSLEGTVVLWLPPGVHLKSGKNPWRRTYRENVIPRWEKDAGYCSKVRAIEPFRNNTSLLLDLIDTSVFDYLIGNADRHHYEVISGVEKGMLVMLDNGKSFGDPQHDERTILAPLYHCCSIRYGTWQMLQSLRNRILSSVLREVLFSEPVAPVLTADHLQAMDRRLENVLQEVEQCIEDNGLKSVIF